MAGDLAPQTSSPFSTGDTALYAPYRYRAPEHFVHYEPMLQQDTMRVSSINKKLPNYDTVQALALVGQADLDNVHKPCTVSEQSDDYLDDESVAILDTLRSCQGKVIKRKEIKKAAANALVS